MPQNRKHPSNRPTIGLGHRDGVQLLKPLADRLVSNTRVQARQESCSPETSGSCSLPSSAASRARTAEDYALPPSGVPRGNTWGKRWGVSPLGKTRGGEGGGIANSQGCGERSRNTELTKPGGFGNSPKAGVAQTHLGPGASPHPRPTGPTPARHPNPRSCSYGSLSPSPRNLDGTGRESGIENLNAARR